MITRETTKIFPEMHPARCNFAVPTFAATEFAVSEPMTAARVSVR